MSPAHKIIVCFLAAIASYGSQAGTTGPYAKWLNEDVTYIIEPAERARFMTLSTDVERQQFIEQFWSRRGAAVNEEHYRRIAYANQRFASKVPGWRTDRGRIYIVFGPPDEIESHPARNTERWKYRSGVLSGAIIEFSYE